jgi:hypothetical protein
MTTVRFYTSPYETPLETRKRFKACCETYDEVLLMGNVQMEPGLNLPSKRLIIDLNGYEILFTPTDPLKMVRSISFTNYANYDITLQNGAIRGWYKYDGIIHKDDPTQQSHGVFLYSTPNDTNTAANRVLTTRNLTITGFYGDGLYVSSCTLKAFNTYVNYCGRNGVTAAQHADVSLMSCQVSDVCAQAFDSEPKAKSCKIALYNSGFITSAAGRYAVTLSGSSPSERSDFTVTDCRITGGVVVVWANGQIYDTNFYTSTEGSGYLPGSHLALLRAYHAGDVTLDGCKFRASDKTIKHTVEIMGTGWGDAPRATIKSCTFLCNQNEYAVFASGATEVTMDRNYFLDDENKAKIYVRTTIGRWENGEMVEPGHMEFSYRRTLSLTNPVMQLGGNPQRNGVTPTLAVTVDSSTILLGTNQPGITVADHETQDAKSHPPPPITV